MTLAAVEPGAGLFGSGSRPLLRAALSGGIENHLAALDELTAEAERLYGADGEPGRTDGAEAEREPEAEPSTLERLRKGKSGMQPRKGWR